MTFVNVKTAASLAVCTISNSSADTPSESGLRGNIPCVSATALPCMATFMYPSTNSSRDVTTKARTLFFFFFLNSQILYRLCRCCIGFFSALHVESLTARRAQGATQSCRNCGKQFRFSSGLVRHRRGCERQCHLPCPLCDRRFYRRDHYQYHLARAHNARDVMKGNTNMSRPKGRAK